MNFWIFFMFMCVAIWLLGNALQMVQTYFFTHLHTKKMTQPVNVHHPVMRRPIFN